MVGMMFVIVRVLLSSVRPRDALSTTENCWLSFRSNSVQPQTGNQEAILGTVDHMNTRQFQTPYEEILESNLPMTNRWVNAFRGNWTNYSIATGLALIGVTGIAIGTGTIAVVVPVAVVLIVIGLLAHLQVTSTESVVRTQLLEAQERLAGEASASRILSGIKTLRGNGTLSRDARLAAAARMATEYPAAIVFNLRDAHGVLAPSNWSYDGQLSHIRDEFEPVDSNDPGAVAARHGSAIVVSMSAGSEQALPAWAEQSGFTQGIVAPITRGLDTVGVVYVLNKSTALPTLNEIEQLELVINFASNDSGSPVNESSQSQNQPFRSIEKTTTNATTAQTLVPIRLAGFTLNPESERMEMDGVLISLSPTEFMLMHTLASSPETPVSAVELMDRCWTKESRPADNAIDVAIFRLRKKLSKTSAGKGTIKTVRGSGYMFIPPASKADSVIVAD